MTRTGRTRNESNAEETEISPLSTVLSPCTLTLLAVKNEKGIPVGFMGIAEHRLEMFFISASERGKGLGKELLKYGIETYSVADLAVNEQNPLAKAFYEHMGFEVYRRTELDEQGNPYPLLYMRRKV